jgi:hypothetical protein
MGGREILETYLNSLSKSTSETDIFPHGTKSLLTSLPLPDKFIYLKPAMHVTRYAVEGLGRF